MQNMNNSFGVGNSIKKGFIICHLTDTYFIKESKIGEKIELPGFGRILKILELLSEKQKEKNVLFVHSGDFLFPSLLSNYFKGKQIVDILNECGLNFCTLGNHDFDGGLGVLKKRIQESKFEYIITNLTTTKIISKKILNYRVWPENSPIIAIFGIAGEMTAKKAQENGFKIKNLKNSLSKNISEVRKRFPNIKILVILSHMSDVEDFQLKKLVSTVWPFYSIIFGGHDHNNLISYNLRSDRCLLVKGKSNGRTMQVVNLSEIINKKNPNLEKNLFVLGSKVYQKIKPSKKIEIRVESWFKKLKKQNTLSSNKIVKKFPKGEVLDGTETSLRKGTTNLGNFVTDCLQKYTDSDFALINSGQIRCDRSFLEKLRVADLLNIFVMEQGGRILVTKLSKKEGILFLRHAYNTVGKGKILQISKGTLDALKKAPSKTEFSVALIADMVFSDEDGFGEILAKHRKTSLANLRKSLRKDIQKNKDLIDCIIKTANHVNYDPKMRYQVGMSFI